MDVPYNSVFILRARQTGMENRGFSEACGARNAALDMQVKP
jgi:hypothetical protein